MSPRSATQVRGGGGRVAITAVVVVLVAVAMMLLVRARPGSEPFDPRSGDGDGARGLVLLLERYGSQVEIVRSVPEVGGDRRVLVLQDRLDEEQRAGLMSFAEAGGVVVMADPQSDLTGGTLDVTPLTTDDVPAPTLGGTAESEATVSVGECDIVSLVHLRGLFVRDGVEFAVPADTPACFGDSRQAFAVTLPVGSGAVVALGDNRVFTNDLLRYADNSGLATALLSPRPGGRVSILVGSEAAKSVADIGSGERTLADLVRPGVWMAITQLAVAFVIFAVARAVRPGRPVSEPEQVPIAGSELVVATGNLMQRARHTQRAGWLMRGNLYRDLCLAFHLPATTSIEALDSAATTITGLTPDRLGACLRREVSTEAELVLLAADLHSIRELTTSQLTTSQGVTS